MMDLNSEYVLVSELKITRGEAVLVFIWNALTQMEVTFLRPR
jgi:hypothetical protein